MQYFNIRSAIMVLFAIQSLDAKTSFCNQYIKDYYTCKFALKNSVPGGGYSVSTGIFGQEETYEILMSQISNWHQAFNFLHNIYLEYKACSNSNKFDLACICFKDRLRDLDNKRISNILTNKNLTESYIEYLHMMDRELTRIPNNVNSARHYCNHDWFKRSLEYAESIALRHSTEANLWLNFDDKIKKCKLKYRSTEYYRCVVLSFPSKVNRFYRIDYIFNEVLENNPELLGQDVNAFFNSTLDSSYVQDNFTIISRNNSDFESYNRTVFDYNSFNTTTVNSSNSTFVDDFKITILKKLKEAKSKLIEIEKIFENLNCSRVNAN